MPHPSPREDTKPWYKHFWPWFLICVPLTSMFFTANFVRFAVTTEDSLVIDDYYKEGRGINARLDKIERAKRLSITSELFVSDGTVELKFLSGQPESGSALELAFFHVTQQTKDFTILLTKDASGTYRGTFEQDIDGKWHVTLMPLDQVWKIQQKVSLPRRSAFSFNP